MFLEKTIKENKALIEFGFWAQQSGALLPDTYLLDLDAIEENARCMKTTADGFDITLYFMLKQLGRNPEVARALAGLGFSGAVCVDFREALGMIRAGVPIGNVGHLVQTPKAALKRILASKPQIVTVYSLEKAAEIDSVCGPDGYRQPVMLRVIGENDTLYPGP
jgi:predicted amino acid racemase